jgi:hypothetical protein
VGQSGHTNYQCLAPQTPSRVTIKGSQRLGPRSQHAKVKPAVEALARFLKPARPPACSKSLGKRGPVEPADARSRDDFDDFTWNEIQFGALSAEIVGTFGLDAQRKLVMTASRLLADPAETLRPVEARCASPPTEGARQVAPWAPQYLTRQGAKPFLW